MSLLDDFRQQKHLVAGVTLAAGLTLCSTESALGQYGVKYLGPDTTKLRPMPDQWTTDDARSGVGQLNECGCPEWPLPSPNVNYRPLERRAEYLEKVAHVKPRKFRQDWRFSHATTGGYAEKGADGKVHCRNGVSNYYYGTDVVADGYRGYSSKLKITLNNPPGALRKDDTLLATSLRSRIYFSRYEMGKPYDPQNTPDKVASVLEMRADYRVGERALDPKYANDAMLRVGVRTYNMGADNKPHLVTDSERDLPEIGNSEVRSRGATEKYLGEMIDWAGRGQGWNFYRGPEVLANGPTYREYIEKLYLADVMDLTPKSQQVTAPEEGHRTKTAKPLKATF